MHLVRLLSASLRTESGRRAYILVNDVNYSCSEVESANEKSPNILCKFIRSIEVEFEAWLCHLLAVSFGGS